MSETKSNKGVFQLENGCWGYRFVITTTEGKKKAQKRVKDEYGNPFKTEKQVLKARNVAMTKTQIQINEIPQKKIVRKTFKDVLLNIRAGIFKKLFRYRYL